MITLFMVMQVAPLAEMKSSMQPVSLDEGVALFGKICFEQFPDSKAAMEIIASPELELTKISETPSEAMQPGDAWASSRARVSYVDAEWMPLDLGSPQCSVTVVMEGQPLHSSIASALATKLSLPVTKFGKDGPNAQTKWDIPQANGDKWRLFLSTTQTPSGTQLRAIMMNLRGKKRK